MNKLTLPILLSSFFIISCNNNNVIKMPAIKIRLQIQQAQILQQTRSDYHPDQRQEIPVTDSSNTIGTDTLNSSVATPNTGTNKSYNDAKGNKDSSKHK